MRNKNENIPAGFIYIYIYIYIYKSLLFRWFMVLVIIGINMLFPGSLAVLPPPVPTCTSSPPMSMADMCTNALGDSDILCWRSEPMVGSWLDIQYPGGVLCTVIDVVASSSIDRYCEVIRVVINQSTTITVSYARTKHFL